MDSLSELTITLSDLAGPSGQEDRVQEYLSRRWRAAGVEVEQTQVGNLIGRLGGEGPKRVLVAHADEIGLMVKSITSNGLIHIWPASPDHRGRPPFWHSPVNNPVTLLADDGDVDGQLVYASGHVRGADRSDGFDWNDWFVDIGATNRDEVESLGIHPGTRIVSSARARLVGDTIVGKAMDDRAALAVVTRLVETIDRSALTCELWVASTVQEENSMIGASSLVDAVGFESAVVLDVGLCGDVPGVDPDDFPGRLRAGPMIVHQDGSVHYSHRLSRELAEVAEDQGLPHQHVVFQYYSTDGAELIRRGVESALVAVPTRYTHTPNEMVAASDLAACVQLLAGLVCR